MGEVWAATHAITRRRVAMKFLKVSATRSSEMHQRFLREARAVSLVRHPGVVEVLDVFELEGGVPVMVMALLVGETLGAKLERDKAIAMDQVVALVLPAVEAVEAAHARGIVHRDLKPDNIFLVAGEAGHVVVKVLDFGIAKLTATEGDAAETGALTSTGSVLGTPWYMAPEQLCGERNIDTRADVWSLGVILYECLSGRRPVEGSNVAQLVARVLRHQIVPIDELVPGLAPELARLVSRMLARAREDRPRDLAEVRQVLARLAATGVSKPPLAIDGSQIALPSHDGQVLALALRETQEAPGDTGVAHSVPGLPRASRSFGASRIAVVLVAVVAVGILGWIVARSNSHPTSELAAGIPALLVTPVAATGTPDAATIPPLPATVAAVALDVEPASSATPLLKPASGEEHAPVGYRHPPVAPPRPTESAVSRRAPVMTDEGVVAKDPPPGASASAQPAASARHKGGGLFERVPF
jgi:tRNA A-37 threonylcarbamoyl transferase component Bud32